MKKICPMKKTLCFLLALCCLAVPSLAAEEARFTDVPEDSWAYGEICRAAGAGAVSGYEDGSFHPKDPVTGAQFCAILARSFLAEELAAQPADLPWQTRALNACASILPGTSLEEGGWQSAASRRDLSRYDMAQMIFRLLGENAAPTPEETAAAQEALADWGQIPPRYRDAVAACLARGLLQGQSGGSFQGKEPVSRAQACVIWTRLQDALAGAETEPAPEPEEPADPIFVLREGETVQQMMNRVNRATPLHPEGGVLSNGEPIANETVQALLEQVRETFPDGTRWTKDSKYHYSSPKMGYSSDCLSFGLAVSDFLFGEDANITQHRDFRRLKAGDVVDIRTEAVHRVLVITGVDEETGAYTACDLQMNKKLDWSEWGNLKDFIDASISCIYSRY